MPSMTPSSNSSRARYSSTVAECGITASRAARPSRAWRRSSSTSSSANFGRIGLRFRGRKAQRRAISTVFSTASGRSAKSATISSWRLEAVLGRQPPARLLLVDVGAVGDADQRVVGVVHRAVGEVHVVGRDERQVEVVGEADEPGLGRLLDRRARRAVLGVPLHLDVEPPGEERRRAARRAPRPARRGRRGSARPSGPSAPPVRQISPVGMGGERRRGSRAAAPRRSRGS